MNLPPEIDRTPGSSNTKARTAQPCTICGTSYLIAPSIAHRYTTCSRACSTIRRQQATNRGRLDLACKSCGKSFTLPVSHIKGVRTGEYCSNACRLQGLNSLPRAVRQMAPCRACQKPFPRPACHGIPDSNGKTRGLFCSRACMWTDDDYRKRRAVRHSPTRLEVWLFEVLDAEKIEYEPFGTVGRYVPDALLPKQRVILEVDGVKWHRPREAYDKQRDRDLAGAGYTVMHFTDIELISRPRAHALLSAAIAEIKAGNAAYRPALLWRAK